MVDRRTRGATVVTIGGVVMLVGTFLPWLRSGARNRSSYTIFDLVERLGFAQGGVIEWSLRLWPLVPLLLVATVITAWAVGTEHLSWPVPLTLASCAVIWVGGTALALLLAPDIALFGVGVGPAVTLAGAALLLGGIVVLRTPEE
ncbi:hypothetical protein [Ilumatobacter sp.]|uniref:hypothetical protein n=1 Tax=Ilumatobacter sp. TaxID=1967498 RepID=UPI003AF867D8